MDQINHWPLTSREKQVLELLTEGLTDKEMGVRLHLSASTVKQYVRSVLSKTQLKNRTQLAVWWVRQEGERKRA